MRMMSNIILIVLCLTRANGFKFNLEKLSRSSGAFGSLFGGMSRAKPITEYFTLASNMDEEEREAAKTALEQNLVILVCLDMGYWFPDIVQEVSKSAAFSNTRAAISLYNDELRRNVAAARLAGKTKAQLTNEANDLAKRLESFKDASNEKFYDDLKALKTSNNQLYQKFSKARKWIKHGGRVAKVLGPIVDALSIGVNAWVLTTSEPGTPGHTSAALGIAAGTFGVVGFFLSLAAVTGPVGVAFGVIGAIIGIASTIYGLLTQGSDVYTVFDRYKDMQEQVEKFRDETSVQLTEAVSTLLTESNVTKWNYAYVMSPANLLDWPENFQNSGLPPGGYIPFEALNKWKVEFGYYRNTKSDSDRVPPGLVASDRKMWQTRDPMFDNKNHVSLGCLPYKGKVNVNGRLQYSKANQNCVDDPGSNKAKIGFDFLGLKNSALKDDDPFQGFVVMCLTKTLKSSQYTLRGLEIQTETADTVSEYRNGDDIVIIDDMRRLENNDADIVIRV